MTEKRYDVVFKGELAPGFAFERVKDNLVKGLSISDEKARRILRSARVVLKRGLDEQGAKQYCAALRKIGMLVYLRVAPMEPVSSTVPLPDKAPKPEQVLTEEARPHKAAVHPQMEQSAAAIQETEFGRPGEKIPFEFQGMGSEYFRIWLVNILLSIITLGIYSAWAKVRRKQYFYGSTRLRGAAFEYLANPVKILKGRLIVVGCLVVYNLVSGAMPLIGLALGLAFVFALPWLVVRSLAFNAYNSAIRNIRFGFHGSYWEAAKMFILWPVLAVFTLGILFPYVYFRQKKFIVENSSYGTTRCTFMATGSDYYRIFFAVALLALGGAVIVSLFSALFPPIAVLAGLVLYLYVFGFVAVKTTNLLYDSAEIGEHGLQASMEVNAYSMIVLTNTVAIALTIGLFYPWARVRAVRYKVEHLALLPRGDLDSFVAGEQKQVSALGDEMSDFLDFDFGL